MATIEQWLDVETEVEKIFGNYLGTTLNLPTFTSDSDRTVSTPRIDMFAVVSEMGPHQFMVPAGTYAGTRLYDQFKITVNVNLVFSPHWNATQEPSNRTAGALRGSLRRCLADWHGLQAAFVASGLLNLASDSLRQTAGTRSINLEEKEETLTTAVAGVFFLNTNVTPS